MLDIIYETLAKTRTKSLWTNFEVGLRKSDLLEVVWKALQFEGVHLKKSEV